MKILQSTIERLLYILLFIVFFVGVVGTIAAIHDGQELKAQQKQYHQDSTNNLKTIEQNQVLQTQILKDYANCIFHINPQGNIQAQVLVCFNNAPVIKP